MAVEEEQTSKEFDEELTKSIGDTLRDIQSREPEEPVVEPVAAKEPVETTVEPQGERARAPDGKFIKDESREPVAPAEQPNKTAQPGVVEQVATDTQIVTTTGQPIDINRAPSSWKPAAKAAWAGLPEPIRSEIHRRESDFLNGQKGIKENADFGQSVKGIVEPYRMLIQAEGGTPEKAIADTMKTAALFRVGTTEKKLEAIFQIDQQFCGGALNKLFNDKIAEAVAKANGQPAPQPSAQPQTFNDPRVDKLLADQQRREQERVANETRVSNSATERFLSAKDDKGQPLYPFVDNVLDDMSERVSNIRRTNPAIGHEEALKQAYEAAVWANPETRAVLLGQQQAQAQQSAETLRKVEQAKRASAGNMPRRGALPATEPVGSIEDTIRDTYRRLTG